MSIRCYSRLRSWYLPLTIQLLGLAAPVGAQPLSSIQTVAGQCNNLGAPTTEPSAATANKLNSSFRGLALDAAGNLYIADDNNSRIRKVDTAGTITTFAGNGGFGFSGDGGSPTSAQFNHAFGVAVDPVTSDVYVADSQNHRVRKISGGTISTIVGNGTQTSTGDGGQGSAATINTPMGLSSINRATFYISPNGLDRSCGS
jgi:DNA-binding beta-propeller fold protein YncE